MLCPARVLALVGLAAATTATAPFTAEPASAFGSDRAAWIAHLHAERRSPTQRVAHRHSGTVETGRIRAPDARAMQQRLAFGHLRMQRTGPRQVAPSHGILPMRRRAPATGQPVVRQAALRPQRGIEARFLPTTVAYSTRHKAGTIVIDTAERFLYLVEGNGRAMRYGVGVGRPGFSWSGTHRITMKKEWPGWTPPAAMRRRQPELPKYMPGGPENPLGARALYLGSTLYRIHGSNAPWTIGHAVSSGCIRMRNEDVIDLYERVKVGTRVVVLR
ncbi:MAG: L,D-transpeptidase [Pseudomonadota bacterium]